MRSRGRGFFSFNSGASRGILSAFSVNRAFLFSVFCVDSGTVPGAARFSFTGSALFRSGTQKSRLYAKEPAERVPALSESPLGEKASEGSHVGRKAGRSVPDSRRGELGGRIVPGLHGPIPGQNAI